MAVRTNTIEWKDLKVCITDIMQGFIAASWWSAIACKNPKISWDTWFELDGTTLWWGIAFICYSTDSDKKPWMATVCVDEPVEIDVSPNRTTIICLDEDLVEDFQSICDPDEWPYNFSQWLGIASVKSVPTSTLPNYKYHIPLYSVSWAWVITRASNWFWANEDLDRKAHQCEYEVWFDWLDGWDPAVMLANWTVWKWDIDNPALWSNFAWIVIAPSSQVFNTWDMVTIQFWWCMPISEIDWNGQFADWDCIYMSTTWFWLLVNTIPLNWNCTPVWVVHCWKLYMSPIARCLAELNAINRIKDLEDRVDLLEIPSLVKRCDIVTVRRVLTGVDAENGSWTFDFWHNMWVPTDCLEMTMAITCANAPQFTTRYAEKVDWAWCDWEQRGCMAVIRADWEIQSFFPTSWNLWSIEVQDSWPNGVVTITAWNQTWNNAQFTVDWADLDCDELVMTFFYKVSWH